jgi:hypothetical protein
MTLNKRNPFLREGEKLVGSGGYLILVNQYMITRNAAWQSNKAPMQTRRQAIKK